MSIQAAQSRPKHRSARRWVAVAGLIVLVTATTAPIGADDTVADLESRRDALRDEAAATAAELDLLAADDAEVAAALEELDRWIASVEADIDATGQAIAAAEDQRRRATEQVAGLDADIALLEVVLAERAVEAYVRPDDQSTEAVLGTEDVNTAARRRFLLSITQSDITQVLDDIRVRRAERDDQLALADTARRAAEAERVTLDGRLAELEEARAAQEDVRAELDERIAIYQAETAELAAADDALSELIREAQKPPPVVVPELPEPEIGAVEEIQPDATPEPTIAPEPTPEAALEPGSPGDAMFQWPVPGAVMSEFGMRVHPIFGDTRMHSGLDIDGGSGDPIGAAAAGEVIFAGAQDGFGNVVIVDHGNSLSTVYAHMSAIAVSAGVAVGAGETLGQVGSTGYSTGPHLHFEVREDGSAVDPRGYLP